MLTVAWLKIIVRIKTNRAWPLLTLIDTDGKDRVLHIYL